MSNLDPGRGASGQRAPPSNRQQPLLSDHRPLAAVDTVFDFLRAFVTSAGVTSADACWIEGGTRPWLPKIRPFDLQSIKGCVCVHASEPL